MGRITPFYTSKKTLNITYQLSETLLGTPITLPTTEPSTPQIQYTVTNASLPTLSIGIASCIWIAFMYGAGKAITAATIYWRMKKNGSSVRTGSLSVAANTYYTFSWSFLNVTVGDVLEAALWSNVSDSNYDYKAFQIQISRVFLLSKIDVHIPCNLTGITTSPTLTLGNPAVASSGSGVLLYHAEIFFAYATITYNISCLKNRATYGAVRLYNGDINFPNNVFAAQTSATYRPYYGNNYVPTQLVYRGVRLD